MCNRRSNLRKTPKFERFSKVWRPVSHNLDVKSSWKFHKLLKSKPSSNVRETKKFYRGKKCLGPPKVRKKLSGYSSKPEVEIDSLPTLLLSVPRGPIKRIIYSGQVGAKCRGYWPPKILSPILPPFWVPEFPKNPPYERSRDPLAIRKF